MARINLKTFERNMTLRPLKLEDYDELVALQERCFPGMKTWSREQIASQLEIFPEGQICITYQGKLVASSSSLIVDSEEHSEWHNWRSISDGGFIRNHDPEGNTLYGIEIMVAPRYRGYKLARRLYDARKRLVRERHLQRIMIGGRIPGYTAHADQMSAREYVEKVMDKTFVDPVLTAQVANGFVLKGLIPDYMPGDKESKGYATFLEWVNLDYVPARRRLATPVAKVRICVVQYRMRPLKSFDEFAQQCAYFVDVASDYKSDFLLFPELFTNPLMSLTPHSRPAEQARALADLTPRYLDLFTDMALKFNVNIIGGSTFAVEEGGLYNVAYLFRRNGTIGKQYKLHVTPSERKWWGVKAGSTVEVFDTDSGKISILICYDVEFPEVCRIAAAKGAQILFVPFNTDERSGYLRIRYCVQARCIENQLFAATAGCVGNLPFVANADIHYAQSGIYTPSDVDFQRDGVAAECTPNIETVVIRDVDLETIRRHRRGGTVMNWVDRRKDLYVLRYKENGEDKEV